MTTTDKPAESTLAALLDELIDAGYDWGRFMEHDERWGESDAGKAKAAELRATILARFDQSAKTTAEQLEPERP